jgi:hypothetical protein
MGKLTCKLSFALGCPNGGNKGVALEINPREMLYEKVTKKKQKR